MRLWTCCWFWGRVSTSFEVTLRCAPSYSYAKMFSSFEGLRPRVSTLFCAKVCWVWSQYYYWRISVGLTCYLSSILRLLAVAAPLNLLCCRRTWSRSLWEAYHRFYCPRAFKILWQAGEADLSESEDSCPSFSFTARKYLPSSLPKCSLAFLAIQPQPLLSGRASVIPSPLGQPKSLQLAQLAFPLRN